MSFARAIATVGGFTMISRVLGFVRDVVTAAVLGAGPLADAFFVAFKLPNFFRRLFGEGAFNAAFVPLFAGLLASEGRLAAWRFAEQAMAVLLAVTLAFTMLAEGGMRGLVLLMAPGFADDLVRFEATVELSRITFPYLLFVSLAALQSGVLNSLDRYAAAAATPILLNLCMLGAAASVALFPTEGHALAWGVVIAGAMQFLWLSVSVAKAGMPLRLPRPRLTPQVRRMLVLMGPALLGAGVTHVNVMVDMIVASLLPAGAVSYLYYADRVAQLPLGVVGVAIGTALLPVLSKQIRGGDEAAAHASQNRAIEYGLMLTLPAAAGLIALAAPVMVVLFRRGEFSMADAMAAAPALAAFSVGLPAYVLIKALTPAFFARHDTKTTVKIAIACLVSNVVLTLSLMQVLAHVGIALATSISSWLNVAALAIILYRRGHLRLDPRTAGRLPRLVIAAAVMGAALVFGQLALWPWLAGHGSAGGGGAGGGVLGVVILFALIGLGGALYFGLAHLIGGLDLREVKRIVKRSGPQSNPPPQTPAA